MCSLRYIKKKHFFKDIYIRDSEAVYLSAMMMINITNKLHFTGYWSPLTAIDVICMSVMAISKYSLME